MFMTKKIHRKKTLGLQLLNFVGTDLDESIFINNTNDYITD